MKYGKIIVAFMLSVALLVNTSAVFSADTAETFSDSINYVTAAARLGLIPKRLAENPSDEVSRGNAISAVVKLCGEDVSAAEDVGFSDINEKSVYYEAVCLAAGMGLVSGFSDNTIRIDEKISVSHTVRMILYALGYKQIINDGMNVGDALSQAGFCNAGEIYNEETLTVSRLAQLLIKGGESKLLLLTNIRSSGSDKNYNYELSENTLFEEKLDIYYASGIVTYCGGADLSLENTHGEDKTVIGGETYTDTVTAENYIGCNVRAYYKSDSNSDEKDILYMYPKDNEILEIDAEDITGYSGGTLYYEVNGKRKSEPLKISSVDFIYNNGICMNPTEKNLKPEEGFVRIIDNDGDGITDVVVVDNYETVVVDSVSKKDGIIYGMYGNMSIDLDKYKNVKFVSETNEKYDIYELSKWDVLSVTRNDGYDNIKLVCAAGMADGSVDRIDYDGNDRMLVISGTAYKVTADFANHELAKMSLGDSGTFYLNTSGKIAAYSESSAKNYGFMIKSAGVRDDASDDTAAKILTAGGSVQIFNYAKKVLFNGKSISRSKLAGISGNTLCIYELNDSNEIKSMETAGGSYGFEDFAQGTSVIKVYDGYTKDASGVPQQSETLTYKSNTSILGGQVSLASGAVIFEVPVGEDSDDKYYKAYKKDDYVSNDKEMCVQAYNSDSDAIAADAVVVYVQRGNYDATTVCDDTHVWVISKLYSDLDESGDERKKLELTDGKSRVTLFAEPDTLSQSIKLNGRNYALKKGDIIRCDYDENNNITACSVLYSAESDEMGTSNPSTTSFAASFRVELCYAYKISESLVITTTTDLRNTETVADESTLENKQLRNLSGYGMVYYDSDKQKVSPGNSDLLKSYIRNKNECSKMFVFDRYGEAKTLVIYD